MFLTEKQKKLIVDALEKKIKGIDWVINNKDLTEEKKDYLQQKAMDMQEIINIMRDKNDS